MSNKVVFGKQKTGLRKQSGEEAAGGEAVRKGRFAIKIITPGAIIRLCVLAVIIVVFCIWAYFTMIKMPGKSYRGPLAELTAEQALLRDELVRDVGKLAGEIGERNVWQWEKLADTADFIEESLKGLGYRLRRQSYDVEGKSCSNIEAALEGAKRPEEIVVVGAHYDTVYGSPGANDNGSGVAAVLALARRFAGKELARTLRFVFFVNEEPPFFQTEQMGSLVYAKECRAKNENIVAMLSIETIGYYSERRKSQKYPLPFGLAYPSTGNFIGFVSNPSSRKLLYRAIGSFRESCKFPSEGAALPEFIPGSDWSDQWSFWQNGYRAIMVTDTAPFRYPYYHSPDDTADKIEYESFAIVVSGLEAVVADMAGLMQ